MSVDIYVLPHAGCASKAVLIAERRFHGLFCPEIPVQVSSGTWPGRCQLCGHPRHAHRRRYKLIWAVREDAARNLTDHGRCPKCLREFPGERLVEVRNPGLGSSASSGHFTFEGFSDQFNRGDWLDTLHQFPARKQGSVP